MRTKNEKKKRKRGGVVVVCSYKYKGRPRLNICPFCLGRSEEKER